MSLPPRVRIVSSAARAIADAADWWRTNRPDLQDAFITDLENTLKLIASYPGVGARARNTTLKGVRRVHLARVHYHLYYRINANQSIDVLALWHSSRGDNPKL